MVKEKKSAEESPSRHPLYHKYIRKKLGKKKDYIVFACQHPACSHYISADLIVGKLSQCNRCNTPFRMTKTAAKKLKPHCKDCTKKVGYAITKAPRNPHDLAVN